MRTTVFLASILLCGCVAPGASGWRARLADRLPELGHRNFIVVADSAYPLQSRPGIETIYTGAEHLDVVREVLAAVDAASHVSPKIYVDAELTMVPEAGAGGIEAFRSALRGELEGREATRLPHMEIIQKLDETAELFNVLILKTNFVLPYTSVFVELDCGYWSEELEGRMRAKIESE